MLFSVVRADWPTTKEHLQSRLKDQARNEDPRSNFPRRLESSRLLFRQYRIEDAPALFKLVENNRFDLWESFPLTFKELSKREDTDGYLLNKLHQWYTKTFFCYGVFLKSSGLHIGQFHIKNIKWDIPGAEFGYFLDIDHRRNGLGNEMLEAALDLCLKEKAMRRVFLRILPTNLPSLRLAEKLSFEYEGLHRKEFITGRGELVDVCYFSKSQI